MLQSYCGSVTFLTRSLSPILGLIWLSVTVAVTGIVVPGQPGSTAPAAKTSAKNKLKRWFELDGLTISARYRVIRNRNFQTVSNQLQLQLSARAHFKFDEDGKYSLHAGLFTGNAINGGWNNTGWGTSDPQTNLYLKQLYFDAKPVKALEIQAGGIAPNNGENTEITGYDNDVYLIGERVAVRLPKKLYFDEISVTNGYIGDLNRPSVFRRLKRLDESNYHQLLVRKKLNDWVSFSADYTFESGIDTLRQAVKIKTRKMYLDSLLFENYERLDPDPGYGFNIYGEKALWKRLVLGGGFARVDRQMLNADRFPRGNRVYGSSSWKISREFSLSSILIQGVGPLPSPSSHRTRFELIFSYNLLETLRRTKLF